MKMKRIAIAVVAVATLASLGGVALAKTPAVGQNTPAASSQPTTVVDADTIQAGNHDDPRQRHRSHERGGRRAADQDRGRIRHRVRRTRRS